jgi:hypothetical protein
MFHTNDPATGTQLVWRPFFAHPTIMGQAGSDPSPRMLPAFFYCGHNAHTSWRQCVQHKLRALLDVIDHHLLKRGPELVRWRESGRHRAARIDRRRRAEFFHTHSAHW